MQKKSTVSVKPQVTYPALVGKILSQQRDARGIKQGVFAESIGLSQSAYSRLEAGESVMNLAQVRNAALQLGLAPSQVLQWADRYEAELRRQGVEVLSEKPDNAAALAIGLGLLAALFMSAR